MCCVASGDVKIEAFDSKVIARVLTGNIAASELLKVFNRFSVTRERDSSGEIREWIAFGENQRPQLVRIGQFTGDKTEAARPPEDRHFITLYRQFNRALSG